MSGLNDMREHKIGRCWLSNCHKQIFKTRRPHIPGHSREGMLHFQDKLSVIRAESFKAGNMQRIVRALTLKVLGMAFGFTRKPAFLLQFTEDLRLYHMARFGLTKLLFTEYAFKVGFFADFHLTCYFFFQNQITKSSEPFHYSLKK